MAQPTTVRGRFVERRKRYLARAARRHRQRPRGRIVPGRGRMHGGHSTVWLLHGSGTKQPATRTKNSRTYTPNQTLPQHFPAMWWTLGLRPPLPAQVSAFIFLAHVSGPGRHLNFAVAGYWQRKVKYHGHKIGRRNGFERSLHAANWWHRNHGCWPTWDPLHRTPVCT
jgi:hypothetical protein